MYVTLGAFRFAVCFFPTLPSATLACRVNVGSCCTKSTPHVCQYVAITCAMKLFNARKLRSKAPSDKFWMLSLLTACPFDTYFDRKPMDVRSF